jgi:hypothetical protein
MPWGYRFVLLFCVSVQTSTSSSILVCVWMTRDIFAATIVLQARLTVKGGGDDANAVTRIHQADVRTDVAEVAAQAGGY